MPNTTKTVITNSIWHKELALEDEFFSAVFGGQNY
jgi:hypothetical protein